MPDFLVGPSQTYTTIQAAIDAVAAIGPLAGLGDHNIIVDDGFVHSGAPLDFSAVTSAVDGRIILKSTGEYTLEFNNGLILNGYCTLSNFVSDTLAGFSTNYFIYDSGSGVDLIVEKFRAKNTAGIDATFFNGGANWRNTLLQDGTITGFSGNFKAAAYQVKTVERITVHGCYDGISRCGAVTDCVVVDSTNDDFYLCTSITNSASSDATAVGTATLTGLVSADEFVDPVNNDFTLKTTSQLIGTGSTGNNIGVDQTTVAVGINVTSVSPNPMIAGSAVVINVANAAATGKTVTYNGHTVSVSSQDANSLTIDAWPYPWQLATADSLFDTSYDLVVTDGGDTDTISIALSADTDEDSFEIVGEPWSTSSIYYDDGGVVDGDFHWGYFSAGGATATVYEDGLVTGVANGDEYTYRIFDTSAGLWGGTGVEVFSLSPNSSPTDITLSSNTVNYSAGTNAVVGTASVTDVDVGDSHTLTIDHVGFTFSGLDLICLDPVGLGAGDYSVTITADDGVSTPYQESFTITVVDDIIPVVTLATVSNIQTGAFVVTATVSETVTDDTPVLTLSSGSAGAISGTGTTRQWTVTPPADSNGVITITVAANSFLDVGGNSNAISNQISVTYDTRSNAAPTLVSSIPNQVGTIGAAVSLDVSTRFSDADGDALTYSVSSGQLPAGLSLNTNTGIVSGTLTTVQSLAGIVISAFDGQATTQSNSFSWAVNDVANAGPSFDGPAIDNQTNAVGDDVSLNISGLFSDPEGDTLSFSVSSGQLPAGLTLNGTTGVISGTLTTAQTLSAITIDASDGQYSVSSNSFSWDVNAVADVIGPVLSTSVVTATYNSLTVTTTSNEKGFAALIAQVGQPTDNEFDAVMTAISANIEFSKTLSSLSVDTAFTLWLQAKDSAGNRTTVQLSGATDPYLVPVRTLVDAVDDDAGTGFEVPRYSQFADGDWPYGVDFSDQATKRSTTLASAVWECVGPGDLTISNIQVEGNKTYAVISGAETGLGYIKVTGTYANGQHRVRFIKVTIKDYTLQ